jgi:hypothetical protein
MSHRCGKTFAVALALVLAASTPAAAQQQIAIGAPASGQLTMADPVWTDGAHYKLFVFQGMAGQTVQIDVTATGSWDPILILQDQMGNEIARDDDGGGYPNPRLQRTLPYSGMYRALVKGYRADSYGFFTINIVPMGMPVTMTMANPTGVLGTIGANQQVTGNLTTMDARWDNKPYQAWAFTCAAGQSFQMDILSSWDNYALVFDPMGNIAARDDDGGPEGNNARINYTCPMAGVYRLAVTTFSTSTTPGPYTLQVQSMMAMMQPQPMAQPTPMPMAQPQAMPGVTMPAPAPQAMPLTGGIPAPGAVGQLQVGQNVQGRLETGDQQMNDGTWADVWQFQGLQGQTVTIELRSEEFDTYVQLLDAAGNRLAEDDDSLGDLNSRVVFQLPATGMYQIVVNNFGDNRRSGIYTLSVR